MNNINKYKLFWEIIESKYLQEIIKKGINNEN